MHGPDQVKKFSALMQSISACPDMSASKSWSKIQESIYLNSLKPFGKKTHTNKDWFEENINVLLPLIKVKRKAHVDYQHDSSSMNLNKLCKARKTF